MATGPGNNVVDRAIKRKLAFARSPEELDESLFGVRDGCGVACLRGRHAEIDTEIPEAGEAVKSAAGLSPGIDIAGPSVKLRCREVGAGSSPKVIEVGVACSDGVGIFGNQAEFDVLREGRFGQIRRSHDRSGRIRTHTVSREGSECPDPSANV